MISTNVAHGLAGHVNSTTAIGPRLVYDIDQLSLYLCSSNYMNEYKYSKKYDIDVYLTRLSGHLKLASQLVRSPIATVIFENDR